jgi:hypothetical protein
VIATGCLLSKQAAYQVFQKGGLSSKIVSQSKWHDLYFPIWTKANGGGSKKGHGNQIDQPKATMPSAFKFDGTCSFLIRFAVPKISGV